MATKPTTRAAGEEEPIIPTGPQSGPLSPFASMPHPTTEVWIENTLNPPETPPDPPPETTMGTTGRDTLHSAHGKDEHNDKAKDKK